MRILHTISGLNVNSGGPSTCIYNLLKGLNASGVQADVLTLDAKREHAELIGNDDFIKAVENDAISPILYTRNFKKYLVKHKTYDLYHANAIWTYPSHATRKCAQQMKKPFVLSPHGMLYSQALSVSSWKKKLILPLFQQKDLKEADCLHATCIAELDSIRRFGLKNPVAVIPNCLNISAGLKRRQEVNSVRRFGFVGRINRIKNIDRLLEAWWRLGQKTKDAELLIIGSGDSVLERELKEYVVEHRLKNVQFTGFLTGNFLENIVRSLDFQVLPSKSENFGMVVPEALINYVPVIASKGTPWEELNMHKCGWWIDNDVNTLQSTIEKALFIPESDRVVMGERGRDLIIDKYTIDQVTVQMRAFYEWMLLGGEKPDFIYL